MSDIDLGQITPEGFAQLVANSSDEQLAQAVDAVGPEAVLDRIFTVMREAFAPDRAQGVNATAQFTLKHGDGAHVYHLRIADGACETGKGPADSPNVSLTLGLIDYLKLIAGKANGPMLFMGGKLQISGDFMLAQRLMAFFDTPKA